MWIRIRHPTPGRKANSPLSPLQGSPLVSSERLTIHKSWIRGTIFGRTKGTIFQRAAALGFRTSQKHAAKPTLPHPRASFWLQTYVLASEVYVPPQACSPFLSAHLILSCTNLSIFHSSSSPAVPGRTVSRFILVRHNPQPTTVLAAGLHGRSLSDQSTRTPLIPSLSTGGRSLTPFLSKGQEFHSIPLYPSYGHIGWVPLDQGER